MHIMVLLRLIVCLPAMAQTPHEGQTQTIISTNCTIIFFQAIILLFRKQRAPFAQISCFT